MILHEDFSLFDYDSKKKNRKVYGKDSPPSYNLTQITAPVHLYYSKGDVTATMENAITLQHQLPNLKSAYLVPVDDFSHSDFGSSRQAKDVVYNDMIKKIHQDNGMS